MTRRLFYEDPYQTRFTARVVERTEKGLILDQTCFYPTSGGQPFDRGTLNGVSVVDVIEEGEKIVHVTEGSVDGDELKGEIEWERRLEHMQQHHGQHILSEAFIQVAGANTDSFHLGEVTSTIELDKPVTPEKIAKAERLANEVVFGNREVKVGFFSQDEAAKLKLRKPPPEGEEKIRIVQVHEFDSQPCCGTHPKRTGEVGVVNVLGADKNVISFVCGHRAVRYAGRNTKILKSLGAKLSASLSELEEAADRLQGQANANRKALQAAEKELAIYRAREMAAAAKEKGRAKVVAEVLQERDVKYLQALANEIIRQPGHVALLGGTGEKSSLVLAAHPELQVDLRPALKEALAIVNGRGGGKPHFVQGGGDGKDIQAALNKAESLIAEKL